MGNKKEKTGEVQPVAENEKQQAAQPATGSETDKKQAAQPATGSETEKTATDKTEGVSVLEKVGKAAIKEHGLKEAFVASDGTVFRTENDAKNYASNLKKKEVLRVKG